MTKKILLALDHTDKSSWETALPTAQAQAQFYGAELHAISVIPEIIQLPNLPAGYGAGARDHVRGAITAILADNGASEVKVHIQEGSIYREILKLAYKEGFDMIIMASNKGNFPDYEIGPNVSRVVRNSHCTVMVVRAG